MESSVGAHSRFELTQVKTGRVGLIDRNGGKRATVTGYPLYVPI